MKYILLILNLVFVELVYSQQVPLLSLRYNEDYSVLKNDTLKNWYSRIKYLPLNRSHSSWRSLGGEYRYQLQYIKNEDWGDAQNDEYTAVYNRLLFHSDIHLGKHVRFFNQLVSTTASGRATPNRSIDENRLDVQQAFVDLNILTLDKRKLVIRFGRQELFYGSQRLIAVREGPNNRLSFDALKAFYKKNNLQVDLFYSHPVKTRLALFDDPINHAEKLWSAYIVANEISVVQNADFYYIGYQNNKKTFNNISVTENRHSIGARFWKKKDAFQYDIEALYQFGKNGSAIIAAYTTSANVTYQFTRIKLKPTMGLKTELISGDKSATDNRVNTFNPLFPKGAYFGLAALIGPVNLIDLHPSVEIELYPKISLAADYDVFWRYSIADGVYGPNAAMLYSAARGKHIGNQLGLSIEYTPFQNLTITPEFTYFNAGKYLKEVSTGKNIIFSAITIQFKY